MIKLVYSQNGETLVFNQYDSIESIPTADMQAASNLCERGTAWLENENGEVVSPMSDDDYKQMEEDNDRYNTFYGYQGAGAGSNNDTPQKENPFSVTSLLKEDDKFIDSFEPDKPQRENPFSVIVGNYTKLLEKYPEMNPLERLLMMDKEELSKED